MVFDILLVLLTNQNCDGLNWRPQFVTSNFHKINRMTKSLIQIPDELIINKIYSIRGQKVMLDRDLAR